MLEVTGLTCGYGDITAVDGRSFTVGAGAIFGLIGATGAGKTTPIMLLAVLLPPLPAVLPPHHRVLPPSTPPSTPPPALPPTMAPEISS